MPSSTIEQNRSASTSLRGRLVPADGRPGVSGKARETAGPTIGWEPPLTPLFVQGSIGNVNDGWNVNRQGYVCAWNNDPNWIMMPGTLTQVAVGIDDTVWGIDVNLPSSGSNVFRWNGTGYWSGTAWTPIPGWLTQISVGSATQVWGVNTTAPKNGSNVFQWNGSAWVGVPGWLTCVAAASDGTVWGVNSAVTDRDNVHQWNGTAWESRPGTLRQISVGSADVVFGIDAEGLTYQWSGDAFERFDAPNFVDLSVAADGTMMGVDANGLVYTALLY
jgi:virginiamycin B lyase